MILWELARATGLVAVALLTVSTVWGILVAGRTFRPAAPQVDVHRLVASLALVLVVLHVATLVADRYAKVPLTAVVGLDARPGIVAGAAALWLLVALPLSFRLRRKKLLSHRAWRRLHWTGYLTWALAIVHGIARGSDTRSPWALGLYSAAAALVAMAAIWRATAPRPARRPHSGRDDGRATAPQPTTP